PVAQLEHDTAGSLAGRGSHPLSSTIFCSALLLTRTSHAPAPRHLRAAGTAVPVALARHRRLTPVGRCKLKTVGVYGPHARSRMLRCGSYQPMGLVSSADRSKTPPELISGWSSMRQAGLSSSQ